jgi:hypothetical protein
MKKLLFFVLFISTTIVAQQKDTASVDYNRVTASVIQWADSTFHTYNEPRFENFVPHYTDEYLMAKMRAESLEKSIQRMEKSKERGGYKGTEAEYEKAMNDLKERKANAVVVGTDFHPKVTHYSITFWSNIRLDTGILNYVRHEIELNDNYQVVKAEITGNIGDNKKGKIVYK